MTVMNANIVLLLLLLLLVVRMMTMMVKVGASNEHDDRHRPGKNSRHDS